MNETKKIARGRSESRSGLSAPSDQVGSSLTLDEVFELLDNRRRRYALHYLNRVGVDESVDVADLSAQIAAWERDTDPDEMTYADRKNVHTSLCQFHIPKMETYGIVEYDAEGRTIRLTEAGTELDVYDQPNEPLRRWSTYFLFVSAAMTVVVLGALLEVPVLGLIPVSAAGFLCAGLFLLSSVGFRYSTSAGPDLAHRTLPRPAD